MEEQEQWASISDYHGDYSLTIEILSNMETKLFLVGLLHVDHKPLNIKTTRKRYSLHLRRAEAVNGAYM